MKTIDQVLAEKLASWYVGEWPLGNLMLCIIAILLCVILSGAIGLERQKRGRNAGLRTHLLVGVGSCIIMIISIYGFPEIKLSNDVILTRDVARLAAQVIAGVGFLGAGAIIHKNSGARGLTTAATIWIVMAIGLACGSMNFILATGSTIVILVFLTLFKKMEANMKSKNPSIIVYAAIGVPIIEKIHAAAKQQNCTVSEFRSEIGDDGLIEFYFNLIPGDPKFNVTDFLAKIEQIEGVKTVGITNNFKL